MEGSRKRGNLQLPKLQRAKLACREKAKVVGNWELQEWLVRELRGQGIDVHHVGTDEDYFNKVPTTTCPHQN